MPGHVPVLLREVVQALNIHSEGMFVDATFGRGGHAREILARLGPSGRLFVMDRDTQAVAAAAQEFTGEERVTVVHTAFSKLGELGQKHRLDDQVDGILFDLGVSSTQLDDPDRGFSFLADGPLDMRMDLSCGVTAAAWLQHVSEQELADAIRIHGEERYARRIARAIVEERQRAALDTTAKLASLISRVVPTREKGKHPATRTFQAIRIAINSELNELAAVLPQTLPLLRSHGRLAVISFHSLEDRQVKRFMRDESRGDAFPPEVPVVAGLLGPRLRVLGPPVRPCAAEVEHNPRARSAVLRVAERVGNGTA